MDIRERLLERALLFTFAGADAAYDGEAVLHASAFCARVCQMMPSSELVLNLNFISL